MSSVGIPSIGAVSGYEIQIALVFGFVILPYVMSTIGFQLLEEKTSFHINKYLGLILGPIILIFIASMLGSLNNKNVIGYPILLFSIFLFILMVKTVNQHFLGNSSWIYAIGIPIVVFLICYYYAKQIDEKKIKEEDQKSFQFLEILPSIYLIGILLLHI